MPIATTYNTGTASVANASTSVTGQGTTWLTSGVQAGDLFWAAGLAVRIASVNSNTSITLAYGWPGASRVTDTYEVRFTPDATRVLASARQLIDMLGNGAVAAIAAVGSAANKFVYYTGVGVAALGDMIAGTTMFQVKHIPHMSGDNTDPGYVRINNGLSASSALGSLRLSSAGEFSYAYNDSVKVSFDTTGKMTGGNIPIPVINNMKNGGSGSTQYFQINGRDDGDQAVGSSIRIATSQYFYLTYNGSEVWGVGIDGAMRSGSISADFINGPGDLILGSANTELIMSSTDVDGMTYSNNGSLKVSNDSTVFALQRRVSDGTIQTFNRGNTQVGSISVTTTATTYGTSSDHRLKTDVEPLVSFTLDEGQMDLLDMSLLAVMAMRPVAYHWIADPDAGWSHGFIAHELQTVAPHAATGTKDEIEEIGTAIVPELIISPEVLVPRRLITPASIDMEDPENPVAVPAVWQEEHIEPARIRPERRIEGLTKAEADKIDGAAWTKTGERPVFQTVDHSKLVADLTAALQSATLMILRQHETIAVLDARVSALEAA